MAEEEIKKEAVVGNLIEADTDRDEFGRFAVGHSLSRIYPKMLGTHLSVEIKQKISNTLKGRKFSDEHRKRISYALKGKYTGEKSSFYGRHHTEETKEKIRKIHKGKVLSVETRRKISLAKIGMKMPPRSEEYRQKMSKASKGRKLSKESIRKGVETRMKRGSYTFSENHKQKMSESHKGKNNYQWGRIGDKSPGWKGGLSFEPYSFEFNWHLKRKIRMRDKFKCQYCGRLQKNTKRVLSVHHINYNKKDNRFCNLVSLCISCHMLTNYNRVFWKNYFGGDKNA